MGGEDFLIYIIWIIISTSSINFIVLFLYSDVKLIVFTNFILFISKLLDFNISVTINPQFYPRFHPYIINMG